MLSGFNTMCDMKIALLMFRGISKNLVNSCWAFTFPSSVNNSKES